MFDAFGVGEITAASVALEILATTCIIVTSEDRLTQSPCLRRALVLGGE